MEFKKVLKKRDIEDGAAIPKGYGFAYWNYQEAKAVFYPIPVNLLANLKRKFEDKIIVPSMSEMDKRLHGVYVKGRIDGYNIYKEYMLCELEKMIGERERAFS